MANPTNINGLLMPSDFDHISYDFVNKVIGDNSGISPSAWEQFAASWSGVAYRYRACVDHSNQFTEAIVADQNMEIRYIQERELFNFFVTGLSVIESFCFAMFAIGTMLEPLSFPLQNDADERKVTPCEVSHRYQIVFSDDEISKEIRNLVGKKKNKGDNRCIESDDVFVEWTSIRNILAHRQATTRIHYLHTKNSQAVPQASQWKRMPIIDFDKNTTESRRIWLSQKLSLLLRASYRFVDEHFN